jgi:hypothetical protein
LIEKHGSYRKFTQNTLFKKDYGEKVLKKWYKKAGTAFMSDYLLVKRG